LPLSLAAISWIWDVTSDRAEASTSSFLWWSDSVAARPCLRPSASSWRFFSFAEFVHHHDAGHHGQAQVADFAELRFQMADILVEAGGQFGQMIFLALLACHAIGLAVDHHRYLCHTSPDPQADHALAVQHCPYRFHGRHQTARDFAVDFLKAVSPELRLVEFLGKTRAVGIDAANLAFDLAPIALSVEASINRIFEAADCAAQLFDRRLDCLSCRHHAFPVHTGQPRIVARRLDFKPSILLDLFGKSPQRQPLAQLIEAVDHRHFKCICTTCGHFKYQLQTAAKNSPQPRSKSPYLLTPSKQVLCVTRFLVRSLEDRDRSLSTELKRNRQ
jgi:hypothetical protein